MKRLGIVRATWTVCLFFASVAFLAGFALDRRPVGIGLALGLLIGGANGELLQRAIAAQASFVLMSVVRMVGVSAVAILLAVVAGASTVAVLLGVAAAQFVMVGAAVRQGLRA